MVVAGSIGVKDPLPSLQPGWVQMRERLINDGAIELTADSMQLTRDVLFKSPSAAAAMLCGGNRNGRKSWKDIKGITLAELEAALLSQD